MFKPIKEFKFTVLPAVELLNYSIGIFRRVSSISLISPEVSAKLRWAGRGPQSSFLHVNEPKKTGAHSERARTRGQNPTRLEYLHRIQYRLDRVVRTILYIPMLSKESFMI